MKLFCCLAITICLTTACSSTSGLNYRPEVSNSDLISYEQDLTVCRTKAENHVALDDTNKGGLVGAAVGAIAGALSKSDKALEAGILGALVGTAAGKLQSNKKQQRFIMQCMQDLGYNVVSD